MNSELSTILFLDIETVASVQNYSELNERLKVQWARKASFFKREQNQTDEELYNLRAGIYSEFGKVIAVGVGKFYEPTPGVLGIKTRCISGHDEKTVLTDFKSLLEKTDQSTLRLCAHNGKEFDFPYLCRRMLVNSVSIPDVLNHAGRKPWEVPHIDTMEMWKFGDHKHYTSLDLLAAIFNIPTSKTEMDGSMVNKVYYEEKNMGKIMTYCKNDVVALAQLYLRMKGMPLVESQHIIEG